MLLKRYNTIQFVIITICNLFYLFNHVPCAVIFLSKIYQLIKIGGEILHSPTISLVQWKVFWAWIKQLFVLCLFVCLVLEFVCLFVGLQVHAEWILLTSS